MQWQHMVRTRSHNGASDDGHGGGHGGGHGDGGGAESNGTASVLPSASSVRMAVDVRYERPLSQWITQFGTPPSSRPREKNWVPFEWRGGLFVEYSLEPRLVLSVDPSTGVGTPLLPITSSPAVAAWVRRLGPVSGGTPAVELPGRCIFLALAHVKLFKKKGTRTATSSMMYKHFWYAFEARPPFALLGTSLPFTLPTQMAGAPSIQFATGLLYRPHTHELIVSYGEMDCHATLRTSRSAPRSTPPRPTKGRRAADAALAAEAHQGAQWLSGLLERAVSHI